MLWLIYGYKGWIRQQITKILKNINDEVIEELARVNDYYQVYLSDRRICQKNMNDKSFGLKR